eukprot:TRINITY_DN4314_c0_g1_i1.p1 TRINITY_DN4314_c0_g1~~TRINITY_DN4314_c0_g1_i1.p1  ORF type:complete len:456 (-),score=120.25 TRINITY_DN4314_c0_g1_i1:1036-2403(-)
MQKSTSLLEQLQQVVTKDCTSEQVKTFLTDFVPDEQEQIGLLTEQRNPTDMLPLHWTASKGNIPLLKWMIQEYNIDPSMQDNSGLSVLHAAAMSGQVEMLEHLLEQYKLDATVQDNMGRTVAHYAAIGGSVKVLETLDMAGVIDRVSILPLNPLVEDIDALLADHFGVRQLHQFLLEVKMAHILDFYEQACLFAQLIQEPPQGEINTTGSVVAGSTSSSSTSGTAVKARFNVEALELGTLLNERHIQATNNRKLQIRIGITKQREVNKQIEHLIDIQNRRASMDSLDFEPKEIFTSLVQDAVEQMRDEYLADFAKSNFAIPLRTYDNCPEFCTLGLAAKYGNIEAVDYLVTQVGVDPNEADMNGTTALHHAAWKQNEEMLMTLLESGANPNVQDRSGNTALHLAVFHNNKVMVSDLILKGAKNFPNKRGQTPVSQAKSTEVAVFIQKSLEQKARR